MVLADILIKLRRESGLSQSELARELNSSRIMIGKYERGESLPSLETAIKIADRFNISLDYLAGTGVNSAFDKRMLNRLEDIEKLTEEDKEKVFNYIDLIIRDAKTRDAYSK